jgi:hypothetical protein
MEIMTDERGDERGGDEWRDGDGEGKEMAEEEEGRWDISWRYLRNKLRKMGQVERVTVEECRSMEVRKSLKTRTRERVDWLEEETPEEETPEESACGIEFKRGRRVSEIAWRSPVLQ